MAGNVRVVLKSVWDDKGIQNAMRSINGISSGITKSFQAIGVATAAAGLAVAKFSYDAVQGGSNLEQQIGALRAVFGGQAEEMEKFAKSMSGFGLSAAESAQMAALLGSQLLGLGLSQDQAMDKTKELQVLAADLAATYGGTTSEAVSALSAIFRGEFNQVERYGVALRKSDINARLAAQGMSGLTGEALKQAEAQAALELIFEKTAVAQGQATREADTFAGRLGELQAEMANVRDEVGLAMLPSVVELMTVFRDDLVPIFRNVAEKVGPAVVDVVEFIAGVFEQAFTEGTDLNVSIGALAESFDLLFGVITGGTKDAEGFSDFMSNLVYLLEWIVTTLASVIAGFEGFGYAMDSLMSGDIGEFWKFLTSDTIEYAQGIKEAERATAEITDATGIAIHELSALNNLKLASVRNEARMTADEFNKLNDASRQYGLARAGKLTGQASGRGLQASGATTATTTSGGGGPSRFEQQSKLIQQTQEQIDNALASYNKAVANARERFADAIADAEKRYAQAIVEATSRRDESLAKAASDHAKNIASIQADFAKRQADIIQQSINRLRDAYRNAVQVNVADLFGTEQVGKSIDTLVTSLRDRLAASRRLLDNSAQLASAGFSQTFIEQVVGAGVETGNELASAILDATPETQSELQELFRALEVESNTGMDTLAQTMYEKTGLATDELKKLYEQTNADLVTALAQAQSDYLATQAEILSTFDQAMKDAADARKSAFDTAQEQLTEALADAATALNEQLDKIQKDFDKKIAEMGGAVKSLKNEINALFGMIASARSAASSISVPAPVAPKVSGTPTITPKTTQPTQVINLNVKTDATQSPAQTANKLLEAINARARSGGGGLVRRL